MVDCNRCIFARANNYKCNADYRQWVQSGGKNVDSNSISASTPTSPTGAGTEIDSAQPDCTTPPANSGPLLSERMRKRRAFADRDLEAVMFQREQQAAAAAELMRHTSPLGWATHQPVFRFHPHLPFHLGQHPNNALFLPPVTNIKVEEEDDDSEVDVTSSCSPPPPPAVTTPVSRNNSSKISFSVESIIGRP